MDDFLLSALDVFQGDLEPEGFLIAVLDEIKKKSSLEPVSSASFQSKALAEIRRRIEIEKALNKEIERLSKELVLCATASENSQRSLQDEFSQVQYQHALHLKDQTENLRVLTEERDLARASERDAKSDLENAKRRHDQIEQDLHGQISQLEYKYDISCQNHNAELLSVNQQRDAALQSLRAEHDASIKLAVTRSVHLSEETFLKEQIQKELEKVQSQGSDLTKKVNDLQRRNESLEKQICSLKKQTPQKKSKPLTTRRLRGSRTDEDGESDSEYDGSSSDYHRSPGSVKRAKPPVGSREPSYRGLPDDLLLLPDNSLSEERRKSLGGLEFVGHKLPKHQDIAIFNRSLLVAQLGGGKISLRVSIAAGNEKPLAKRLGVKSYVCPNLDHNPWAPSSPGKAGFMFVGLGNEQDAFASAETHEMFVQFAPKRMFYAGRYRCKKVQDLDPKEWAALDSKVKWKYCETTDSKTNKCRDKDKRRTEAIMSEYNEGTRHVPCVLLECVEFNSELYIALSEVPRPVDLTPQASRRASAPQIQAQHPKRKRNIVDDLDAPGTESPQTNETTQSSKKPRNVVQGSSDKGDQVFRDDVDVGRAGSSGQSPILVD